MVLSAMNIPLPVKRLLEYATEKGLPTPSFDTIRFGSPHFPLYRSAVLLNGARYNSLLVFSTPMAAEHSAAEAALQELEKSGDIGVTVSSCYIFKSRVQEYAQRHGFLAPVYETIKSGPSHMPLFCSTVTLNGVKYFSQPGFRNRKAAEQSAAEVALLEIAKSGQEDVDASESVPETGLCKNHLQEYSQKMCYALPRYQCKRERGTSLTGLPYFSCTVEVGGTKYTGGASNTKKGAEIKAARTALLSFNMNCGHRSGNLSTLDASSKLTILPCHGEEFEMSRSTSEILQVKRSRHFKKRTKRRDRKKRAMEKVGNLVNEAMTADLIIDEESATISNPSNGTLHEGQAAFAAAEGRGAEARGATAVNLSNDDRDAVDFSCSEVESADVVNLSNGISGEVQPEFVADVANLSNGISDVVQPAFVAAVDLSCYEAQGVGVEGEQTGEGDSLSCGEAPGNPVVVNPSSDAVEEVQDVVTAAVDDRIVEGEETVKEDPLYC